MKIKTEMPELQKVFIRSDAQQVRGWQEFID